MKQFAVIYRVPVETMNEWRKTTSPEEMKKQGEKLEADMQAWMKKHEGMFVGAGVPLGKTKRVSGAGIVDTQNDLNYYCVVQAESHDEAAKMFLDNPHTQIPNSYVEVMKIPHMGM